MTAALFAFGFVLGLMLGGALILHAALAVYEWVARQRKAARR